MKTNIILILFYGLIGCANQSGRVDDPFVDQYCTQMTNQFSDMMRLDMDEYGPTLGSGGMSQHQKNIPVECRDY